MVTRPSAADTMILGSLGTVRCGSRKKYAMNKLRKINRAAATHQAKMPKNTTKSAGMSTNGIPSLTIKNNVLYYTIGAIC